MLALASAPRAERLERLGGGELGVRAQMQVAGFRAVGEPARIGVDLHDLGLREHVTAVDGVVVQARPEGDDEIGLRAQLAGDVAGVAAGDADRERIVVEHAARRQRGRKQRASLIGQLLDLDRRARAQRAAAGDDDRTLGAGELVGQLLDLVRMGKHRLGVRQDVGRWLIVADVGQRLLLQIVGHAEHHRHALDGARCGMPRGRIDTCAVGCARKCSARRRRRRAAAGRSPGCTTWRRSAASPANTTSGMCPARRPPARS